MMFKCIKLSKQLPKVKCKVYKKSQNEMKKYILSFFI